MVTIPIHAEKQDDPAGEAGRGTFKGPWLRLALHRGKQVRWTINPNGFSFAVTFAAWPFQEPQPPLLTIRDSTPYTLQSGLMVGQRFKYSVTVVDDAGAKIDTIDPDLEVL
jgi:hypothetical protein